jgi:ABC-type glucose/galactose transport system permease subunit
MVVKIILVFILQGLFFDLVGIVIISAFSDVLKSYLQGFKNLAG